MTDVNLFELASRKAFRFPSTRGNLTVEQLWDLPLTAKNAPSLDTVARGVAAELRGVTEESFVATESNPAKAELEAKLEILKHVIAVRQAENEAKRTAAAKAAEKAKLLEVLERKQEGALENLTEEQIRERIAAL